MPPRPPPSPHPGAPPPPPVSPPVTRPTQYIGIAVPASVAATVLLLCFLLKLRPKKEGRAEDVEMGEVYTEHIAVLAIQSAKANLAHMHSHFGRPAGPQGMQTTRFETSFRELVVGQPEFAAHSLERFMRVPTNVQPPSLEQGVDAIVREVKQNGNPIMVECLSYVLEHAAGSSDKLFPNSAYPRDCDENGVRADRKTASGEGMRFGDFVADEEARGADLHPPHVLALRLYTTAAFISINAPLRQLSDEGDRCAQPHPFPNTVRFMRDAIRQLRGQTMRKNNVTSGNLDAAGTQQFLYRGFKDVKPSADFLKRGGSELATMSTTTSLEVALRYAASENPVLLRLHVRSFMQRGADVSFCSAFPAENEVLYPPQTFILPSHSREIEGITVVDAEVTVG